MKNFLLLTVTMLSLSGVAHAESNKSIIQAKNKIPSYAVNLKKTVLLIDLISVKLDHNLSTKSETKKEITATVAKDVYTSRGQTILIPKGTKVLGTFNPTVESIISWEKLQFLDGTEKYIVGEGLDNSNRIYSMRNAPKVLNKDTIMRISLLQDIYFN